MKQEVINTWMVHTTEKETGNYATETHHDTHDSILYIYQE